jgi:S-DNA-T family DNA segregation ATPase FtsK/SpoIIIE
VLLVDELMIYLTGEKRAAAELASLLRRLVALGRAAGIICVLATQKPSADVVPSSIRDNVAYRVAFRTTTREASDTILGGGWASNGYSATDIDAATPGVCWLLAEGASPRKLRCAYLADDELDAIVARATALRP